MQVNSIFPQTLHAYVNTASFKRHILEKKYTISIKYMDYAPLVSLTFKWWQCQH